jgi:hypothetical protein
MRKTLLVMAPMWLAPAFVHVVFNHGSLLSGLGICLLGVVGWSCGMVLVELVWRVREKRVGSAGSGEAPARAGRSGP